MSAAGRAAPCGTDHVKALLQTAAAASTSSSCCSSRINRASSRKGAASSSWSPWPLHHQAISAGRNKMDSFGFLGQQHGVGSLAELCKCLPQAPDQPFYPISIPRSHVREGGADSESKGSNHSSESRKSTLKKEPSLLLSLVQEIQPLDASQISKEVSPDSTDAMKRTVSGMLGLLPSDQFHVSVDTTHEPLAKLFVSSMMTGYTLRNAEYILCLQKSLEFSGDDERGEGNESAEYDLPLGVEGLFDCGHKEEERHHIAGKAVEDKGVLSALEDGLDFSQSLGSISEEAKHYIQYLEQKLTSATKELEECKQINAGLQVQSIVGEEKNDLLDYLRSLSPEKVAELSQPTSPEVEDVIQQVIIGLLDSPLTRIQQKGSQCGNGTTGTFMGLWKEEGTHNFSAFPLKSQSGVSVNRDHLARLLFWCMLLGHHMRGVEYRLELSRTLNLCGDLDSGGTKRDYDG